MPRVDAPPIAAVRTRVREEAEHVHVVGCGVVRAPERRRGGFVASHVDLHAAEVGERGSVARDLLQRALETAGRLIEVASGMAADAAIDPQLCGRVRVVREITVGDGGSFLMTRLPA